MNIGPSPLSGPTPRPDRAQMNPVDGPMPPASTSIPAAPDDGRTGPPDSFEIPKRAGQAATRIDLPASAPPRSSGAPSTLDGLQRDPALEKHLKDTMARHGLRGSGAVVMDLDRGVFAGHNEGGAYSPASVIKVPVMVEVMKQVEAGKLSYSGNVKALVEKMIIASDNQATNQLIDLVDPSRKRVSATMKEILGNSDIQLYNKMFPPTYQRKNQGSARAFAMLLKRIEEGQVISPGASARMKAIMGRNADDAMIQRGLNQAELGGARLYNKTGGTSEALNDAGIIEVGDRRYVLSIFTPQDARVGGTTERLAAVTRDLVQFLEARQAREATDPTAVTAPTSSPERP